MADQKIGVFLSHSSKDKKWVREFGDYLREQDFEVWLDETDLAGGEVIYSQIGRSISRISCLVVWVTVNSLCSSPWVEDEIVLARREGVRIIPVVPGNSGLMPDDLRNPEALRAFVSKHQTEEEKKAYASRCSKSDFFSYEVFDWLFKTYEVIHWVNDAERGKLLKTLKESYERFPILFMAHTLPRNLVKRDKILAAIKSKVLFGTEAVALVGGKGFGKTWLTVAICHDKEVWRRFPEGILWVTLGEKPHDLLAKLGTLIAKLAKNGEDPPLDINTARARLGALLDNKKILLVIDDVWRAEDLEPFLMGGQGTVGRLITTRSPQVLPQHTLMVTVGKMPEAEAVKVLSSGLASSSRVIDSKVKSRLKGMARQVGHCPLFLAKIGGQLADKVRLEMPLAEAMDQSELQLQKEGLVSFDVSDSERSV